MFSISFRKHRDEKKKRKKLVNSDYQNVNLLFKSITSVTLVEH